MRAILAIAVGAAFVAMALLGVGPDGAPLPMALRWAIGIFSLILCLAGISHLRLRLRRRQAYANGRQKRGTARLHRPLHPESDEVTAIVVFATDRAEWIMTLDLSSIKGLEHGLGEGLPARAWLGNDNYIYALDIKGKRTLPISAGMPLDRKLKDRISRAEQRMIRMAGKKKT